MHHCGGIADAAVVPISKGGNVPLPHVFDNLEEVCLDIESGGFASGVRKERSNCRLFLLQGIVITTLATISCALCFCLEKFIGKDTITPAAIVVKKCECNVVIPKALYLLVLHLCHRCSSDYIFIPWLEAGWMQGTRGSVTQLPVGI